MELDNAFWLRFQALPTELLRPILELVPNAQVKEFALLDRRIHCLARERLFCTLTIASSKRQLRRLARAAGDAALAPLVKCVRFEGTAYRYGRAQALLAQEMVSAEKKEDKSLLRDLKVGLHYTRNLGDDQYDIEHHRRDVLALVQCLPKLVCLQRIECCASSTAFIELYRHRPKVPLFDLYEQRDLSALARLAFKAVKNARAQPGTLTVEDYSDFGHARYHGYRFGLRAKRALLTAHKFFAGLTELNLFFKHPSQAYYDGRRHRPAWFRFGGGSKALIQSAQCLKRLRLGFNCLPDWKGWGYSPYTFASLDWCLGEVHWENLRSLHLIGMAVFTSELVSFLEVHRETLCTVILDSMLLIYGSWNEITDVLGTFPVLSRISITDAAFIEADMKERCLASRPQIVFDPLAPDNPIQMVKDCGALEECIRAGDSTRLSPQERAIARQLAIRSRSLQTS